MDDGGLWHPALDLEGFAWSPDDAWLAVWTANGTVRCLEASTWREVLSIPGMPVHAVAWPDAETLWVVREQDRQVGRVVAHAVPDGGVTRSVRLPQGLTTRSTVSVSHGGRVLVAPWHWPPEPRARARTRPAWVLSPSMEVLQTLDPHDHDAPPYDHFRQCRAVISPDGTRVALAYGGELDPTSALPRERARGWLRVLDVASGKCVANVEGGHAPVDEVLWAGPSTVAICAGSLLATTLGRVGAELVGCELFIADTALETVRYRASRDASNNGFHAGAGNGRPTPMALHPDRSRLVVVGHDRDPVAGSAIPRATPTLTLVDVDHGTVGASVRLKARATPGVGATWMGAGDALAVLTFRTATAALLTHWPSIDAGPAGSIALAPSGPKPSDASVARSPAGRWLTARWDVNASGKPPFTRIAVIRAEALSSLPRA